MVRASLRTAIRGEELQRLPFICSQTSNGIFDGLMASGSLVKGDGCEAAVDFVRRCKKERRLGRYASNSFEQMQRFPSSWWRDPLGDRPDLW